MWNENAPLELLKELPAVLNDANLARLQNVIDIDKFVNSSECGYDLCGAYAPFCSVCDKSLPHPCAVAYVRMKQAQGYSVEMENIPSLSKVAAAEQPVAEQAAEEQPVAEQAVEEQPAAEQSATQTPSGEVPAKKVIRIAIARRKS